MRLEERLGQSKAIDAARLDGLKHGLLLRMAGSVPINLVDGAIRMKNIRDLELIRQARTNFHPNPDSQLKDAEFCSLVQGIPNLEEAVNELGRLPAIVRHYRREITYEDILLTDFLLYQYMTGQREVVVRQNGKMRITRVLSPKGSRALNEAVIRQGADMQLLRLLNRVENDGMRWRVFFDAEGKREEVVNYYGRPLFYEDTGGKPVAGSEATKLFYYINGSIPVLTEEGEIVPSKIEDFWIFQIFKDGKEAHTDKNLMSLFFRLDHRRSGKGFKQEFNEVGRCPLIVEKYGRAVTYRDVVVWSLIHSYMIELEEIISGGRTLLTALGDKTIKSLDDMHLLRPDAKAALPEVRSLRDRVWSFFPETGLGFYDVLDLAGARPAVVKFYGRAVTRHDVNPYRKKFVRMAA